MGIIQKPADELKPGDVIKWGCESRYVLLQPVANLSSGNSIQKLQFASLEENAEAKPELVQFTYVPNKEFEVESPDLTPAQQHAEELAKAVDELVTSASTTVDGSPSRQSVEACAAILREIKPPEPPTLAELALALDKMHDLAHAERSAFGREDQADIKAADVLLDRARRARLLT